MTVETSFRVEDFLEALTAQLDRTQDALAFKSEIRPLTYAIREFSLELKVFVEMGDDGQVRLRSSGPNETGASTVSVEFTTITRPMIEENTVALAQVQSPSLDDLGLAPQEQRSLERLGVRNAAQLRKLNSSSGEKALARFADIPVNRLRAALQASRPEVSSVTADEDPEQPGRPSGGDASEPRTAPAVKVPSGTRRLRLDGLNLRGLGRQGSATLGGVGVPIVEAEDDHAVIDLGNRPAAGRLEIHLDGGDTLAFELSSTTAPRLVDDAWTPT